MTGIEVPREPLKQEPAKSTVTMPDGKVVVHEYGMWPKQKLFHLSRKRYVCFGGARGPGKTVAIVEDAIRTMLRWPGIPILILRKDLKDLKRTTLREFLLRCPKEFYDPRYGGQYNKSESWVRFFNGSIAYFGELKDWESYKSMTVGKIYIDEANEIEEEAFVNLDPTLRWTTGKGECRYEECKKLGEEFARPHSEHPVYQIKMATNPAPGWIKQRFWDPWKMKNERPEHEFIPATAFDNPSLPPDFIPRLMEQHTATWVLNYVHGDWSSFENMVWERFNRGLHLWRGPLPEFTRVEGGIDYGGTTKDSHRTCAYLTGVTREGYYVTFWEYSKQGGASRDFFATLSAVTRQFRVQRWEADASQHRANELLRDAGVPVYDADRYAGAVRDGINLVDRLLTPDPNTKRPQLFIVEEACPRLVSGIETYRLDPETGEPEKNQEDDEVNAWRYNITGITRAKPILEDWEPKVLVPAGAPPVKGPSSMLRNIREERRTRLRTYLRKLGDN